MRAVTGKPIKVLGTGEKSDALEEFDPQRIANRILGMGDIVGLVEKAAANLDVEKAQKLAERMKKGSFDLNDMAQQLDQMQKIGGMQGMLGMMPGIGKMKKQLEGANLDDRVLKRQAAIIGSMTRQERRKPDILKASRKKRIAAGSGTRVEDVNRLLKMHRQMADMMKAVGKGKGGLAKLFGMGGGMPPGMPNPSPEELAAMQAEGGLPKGMPSLPGGLAGLPPGFGAGGLPPGPAGLPGLPKGFIKKK
jgi:signal recognition particle subunit SRP54